MRKLKQIFIVLVYLAYYLRPKLQIHELIKLLGMQKLRIASSFYNIWRLEPLAEGKLLLDDGILL